MPYMFSDVWQLNNGSYVVLDDHVLEIFQEHRQIEDLYESGGVLYGELKEGHFRVAFATKPSSLDKRERLSFVRQPEGHTVDMNEEMGDFRYVGEWHTHPQFDPQPSPTDKKSWEHIISNNRAPILTIIVGTHNLYISSVSKFDKCHYPAKAVINQD